MFSPQTRTGETNKKTITLTDGGREQIQYFADAHGMTFSATIETLALIGMNADLTALLIPLLREVVDKAMQRNFNRIAKLSLISAAEAAMAHDLTTMLLLQFIRQEALANPDDFEEVMRVSYDPDDELDARMRALYQEARQLAHTRQQRLLKIPLQELVVRLAGLTEADEEEETDE
ncbi:MAG: hypothetical protein KJ069_32130 [Anaerolineae bacterium]|nr:hypothetical protein [Anaerolineae bacterium]